VAARESSLLSPSGSKAGKAHRVPISSQEAFFLPGGVQGAGRDEKALLSAFHTCQGELEPALAPGERQGCNTLKQKNALQGLRETQEMSLLRPRSDPPFK
jgi:hypothetical protein